MGLGHHWDVSYTRLMGGWGLGGGRHLPHAQGWVLRGSGPTPILPWSKPSEGDGHQWSPAALCGSPLHLHLPDGFSALLPAPASFSCSTRSITSITCRESRAVPAPPAQCKAVVTIASPQPPWSGEWVVHREGRDGSEGPICSTEPCAPQSVTLIPTSCTPTHFLLLPHCLLQAVHLGHILLAPPQCSLLLLVGSLEQHQVLLPVILLWGGGAKGKTPQGAPCQVSRLGASLVGLGEPHCGGLAVLPWLWGHHDALPGVTPLLHPHSTPRQSLPAPASVRTRISSFCSCWTWSFSLLISAVPATSSRFSVAATAVPSPHRPARGQRSAPCWNRGPSASTSPVPITHRACPAAPPGS